MSIWESFAYNGADSIGFISGKINSQSHQHVLESHLLRNAEFLAGEKWKFQQDNAPVHASNSTKHSTMLKP